MRGRMPPVATSRLLPPSHVQIEPAGPSSSRSIAVQDIDQAVQRTETPAGGGTVDRPHFVARPRPDRRCRTIEHVRGAECRHVDNAVAVTLIQDGVHIGYVGPPINARGHRDADHAVAGCLALLSDGIEAGSRRFRKVGPTGQVGVYGAPCGRASQEPLGQSGVAYEYRAVADRHHVHRHVVVRRIFQ